VKIQVHAMFLSRKIAGKALNIMSIFRDVFIFLHFSVSEISRYLKVSVSWWFRAQILGQTAWV